MILWTEIKIYPSTFDFHASEPNDNIMKIIKLLIIIYCRANGSVLLIHTIKNLVNAMCGALAIKVLTVNYLVLDVENFIMFYEGNR